MDQEEFLREDAESRLLQEAEKRRFLYSDVEELIDVGFLTHTFVIEGVPVVLRSLLPEDQKRYSVRAGYLSSPYDILRWGVASSVYMLNGYAIEFEANAAYHVHQEWASTLPAPLLDVLGTAVIGFRNRVERAIRLIEAFCYETYSRSLWRMNGRNLGDLKNANVIRRLWVAFNLAEDDEKADTRTWSHTRTIVGSMSNKAAKYISGELKKTDDKEKNRRQRVIEDTVNWVIRGDEKRKPLIVRVDGKEVEVPHIHSAQSVEDLEEEMRRVFAGDKDYHDLMVDQYQNNIRKNVLAKREERQRIIEEARRRADEALDADAPPIVGYTEEQLREFRPEFAGTKTTASMPTSAQTNYVFDRYYFPTIQPGVLTPNLKVEAPSTSDPRLLRPDDAEEGPSLQEKIARRTIRVNDG